MKDLEPRDIQRIIEMAWEDRTPFEAIDVQFGLSEAEVIRLMRKELSRTGFCRWRRRVNEGSSHKHARKQPLQMQRFRCSRQRTISYNSIT